MDVADELERLADEALAAARRAGARSAEVFLENETSVSVEIEGGAVKSAARVTERALGLRVLVNGALGHAAGPPTGLDELARAAVAAALPTPSGFEFASEGGARSASVRELPDGVTLIDDAARMLAAAERPGLKVVGGGLGWAGLTTVLATSDGYRHVFADATGAAGLSCVAEATRPGAASATTWARDGRLAVDDIVDEAVGHALATRDPGPLDGDVRCVVFHPRALSGLVASTLIPALDGAAQARRESPFVTTDGPIAAEGVRISEHGADAATPMLFTHDDEGRAFSRTDYVRDGAALTAVASVEDAAQHGLDVPGWSWRSAPLSGRAAHGRPGSSPGNLLLDAPRASHEETLAEAQRGLYVLDVLGAHTANPTTGRFAVEASTAYRIGSGGELSPVGGALVSGTLVELLRGLRLSTAPEPRPSWDAPGLLLGHTLVEGLRVTGRKPEGSSSRSGNP